MIDNGHLNSDCSKVMAIISSLLLVFFIIVAIQPFFGIIIIFYVFSKLKKPRALSDILKKLGIYECLVKNEQFKYWLLKTDKEKSTEMFEKSRETEKSENRERRDKIKESRAEHERKSKIYLGDKTYTKKDYKPTVSYHSENSSPSRITRSPNKEVRKHSTDVLSKSIWDDYESVTESFDKSRK